MSTSSHSLAATTALSLLVACGDAGPARSEASRAAQPIAATSSALESTRRTADPFVTTVLGPRLGIGDALSSDAEGRLYASDFTGTGTVDAPNGRTVSRIERDGSLTPFVSEVAGPAGSAFARDGSFYVAAFLGGQVLRRDRRGASTVFADGLDGPVGVAIDAADRIYVSVSGLAGPGSSVFRYTRNGERETFVDLAVGASPTFALGGLAFDGRGDLYVSNFLDGRIARVRPDGSSSLFATVPNLSFPAIGYLAFHGDELLATGIGANRVFAIAGDGAVSVFAGSGEATERDGKASTAAFNGPNGIVAGRRGCAVFVSDTNGKTLRRVFRARNGECTSQAGDDGFRFGG